MYENQIEQVLSDIDRETESENKLPLTVLSITQLLEQDFPPREYLMYPWLPARGLVMVYAWRGVGKTMLTMSVAYAVACGASLVSDWQAPKAVGVLYVDGEMPAPDLQLRFARLAKRFGAPACLDVITPDCQLRGMPDLASESGQAALDSVIRDEHQLIVIDNLSTLVRGAAENESDAWVSVQSWALRHRAAGRTILFVHHESKSGVQRGTSRREDTLDVVVRLVKGEADDGCSFQVKYEKFRLGAQPSSIEMEMSVEDDEITWRSMEPENSPYEQMIAYVRRNPSASQRTIAKDIGISLGCVNKYLVRAKREERLD